MGVRIDLNVRGVCCLRPGVAGISDNIRVVSILDRYLEHSRIVYFHAGGKELMFISSADWMPRNLVRRVELLVPIDDPEAKQRLKEVLQSYAQDNVKGRVLKQDTHYYRVRPATGQRPHQHQHYMHLRAQGAEAELPHP